MGKKIIDSSIKNIRREGISMRFYNLQLGQSFSLSDNPKASITRVPGGWVYDRSNISGASSCFIPFNDEFSR